MASVPTVNLFYSLVAFGGSEWLITPTLVLTLVDKHGQSALHIVLWTYVQVWGYVQV